MKSLIAASLLLAICASFTYSWLSPANGNGADKKRLTAKVKSHSALPKPEFQKIRTKAAEAKRFANSNKYNTAFCFLIDMSLHSGTERFFVFDLDKDSISHSGLVTHGRCNEDWLEGRRYGNSVGCGCTSLGKYKIGYQYTGRFGLAFKLYGLDKTNDKAFERFVVLHSHECVPSGKVSNEICQSDGCPTVSPDFLAILAPLIRNSDKPVLLWIFE